MPRTVRAQTEDLASAESLLAQASEFFSAGRYGDALPLVRRLLAIREKALGPEHPDTATTLKDLADVYHATGSYAQAEPLYKRALAIREKALGSQHPDTALSLNSLAMLYHDTGDYDQAEPLQKRALAIWEKAFGPQHPDTVTSLNNLAAIYHAAGAYTKAEPLYRRALTIWEKELGPEHPDTALGLNNLALLYCDTGDYGQAEPLYKRALAIREKALGPQHPDTALSLNNLADLYRVTGAYAQAEPLHKRALAIFEKALGPEHPHTATSVNNLAILYSDAGAYARAEPLYTRALAIREKALGPQHPDTARSLGNLAGLYQNTGAYAQAEPLYTRALAIQEKALGPEHPGTATSVNNLAELYRLTGAYAQAEPLFKRALAIVEKALGPQHPDTAGSLNNLAALYRDMGVIAQAEPLYERALAIVEKALGPQHPDTAGSLDNRALLYRATGDYARAESLYKRSLAIQEKALGPQHPKTAVTLTNLALLQWAQGRWSETAASIQRVLRIEEANARSILLLGDESRKRAYAAMFSGSTQMAVAFSLDSHGMAAGSVRFGLEVVLQRKGRVQDVMADSFAVARTSLSPSDRRLFDEWREANAQFAALNFRGPDTLPVDKYRDLLESSRARAESLEAELSRRSAPFQAQVETVTIERTQAMLPPGAVLIEWFKYHPLNPGAADENESLWGEPRYVAYVLKREGQPVAVDIGEAKAVETMVSDLLVALRERAAIVATLARELEQRLMQPLQRHIGNAEQILLSPDGVLNLLPFAVLRDGQGRYLVQRKELTYLTAGRDLLRARPTTPSRQPPLVLADPDFGPLVGSAIASTSQKRPSPDLSGGMSFKPLPGTAAEARAVKVALGLKDEQVLTRRAATEAALKQAKGPRIVHIATHGFFRASQEQLAPGRGRGWVNLAPGEQWPGGVRRGEDPLLRSGLVFAGANQLRSGNDDGILTALEVAGLDLAGTELVVLSACETGLGKVNDGEGVYGLRRALVLAGARTQLASLWKVDDAATRDLMIDYYTRLSGGVGRAQALREAQLAMADNAGRADPYYWAAFVVIGDGTPLTF